MGEDVEFLDFPLQFWLGIAATGVVLPVLWRLMTAALTWWRTQRPINKLLEGLSAPEEPCAIFAQDFFIEDPSLAGTPLRAAAAWYVAGPGRPLVGRVPNVRELWADVDARAAAYVLNVLGQAGKATNITVVPLSHDTGMWNANLVLVGGQSQKSMDFYARMPKVFYRMDGEHIYDNVVGAALERQAGFAYGIILKSRNPFKTSGGRGVALLVGGFGTLGTAAAAYYLRENAKLLGRQFGSRCFGVVVRASQTAGEQSVEGVAHRAEPAWLGLRLWGSSALEVVRALAQRAINAPALAGSVLRASLLSMARGPTLVWHAYVRLVARLMRWLVR